MNDWLQSFLMHFFGGEGLQNSANSSKFGEEIPGFLVKIYTCQLQQDIQVLGWLLVPQNCLLLFDWELVRCQIFGNLIALSRRV